MRVLPSVVTCLVIDVSCVKHVIIGTLEQQTNHTRLGYISTCIGGIAAVEAQSVRFLHACSRNLPRSRRPNDATANRSSRSIITNQQFDDKDNRFCARRLLSGLGRHCCRPEGGQCFRAAGVFVSPRMSRNTAAVMHKRRARHAGGMSHKGMASASFGTGRPKYFAGRTRQTFQRGTAATGSVWRAVATEMLRCWSRAELNVQC